MPITGSVEILTDGGATSTGLVLEVEDVGRIPDGLAVLRSLSGFAAFDPDPEVYREVDAAWTAETVTGAEAVVLWREDRPFSAILAAEAAARGEE